ncbi:MAG: hypothetical protein ACSW75_03080 [Lachnospiraceae bacterium]
MFILGVTLISTAFAILLKVRDRKAYPKLIRRKRMVDRQQFAVRRF